MNLIGKKFRELRESKNLPLRKVAAVIDIDQAILSKIERGERYPSKDQIILLGEYFGLNVKQLIEEYLGEKIALEIIDEENHSGILKMVEEKIKVISEQNNHN